MSCRSALSILAAWILVGLPGLPAPSEAAAASSAAPSSTEDVEPEELRERLTEREDKRRPPDPWSTQLAGYPLVVSGEYEIDLGYLRRRILGPTEGDSRHRMLLEQSLELEAYYSVGPPFSIFAQFRGVMDEDLLSHTRDELSEAYVERGEMWLHSEGIAGTPLALDLGRLDFEDDRRWWWDDELDALRIGYETDSAELTLALARELAPERFDQDYVDPEKERLLRGLAEFSWDWSRHHVIQAFALHQRDHSPEERPGELLHSDREDESDARLTWLGLRAQGAVELAGDRGLLGYWLDAAALRGHERLTVYAETSPRRSRVESVGSRDVRGWALDAGLSWHLPFRAEPRFLVGYAFGSGDSSPESGSDRAFRQSGLQSNEAGFGGVERFAEYGVLLDPELSNLGVLTLGAGVSLLRASSLDLVYHHYRLNEPAPELRDARLELDLDGRHRALGHGLDLVLALEEWTHLELELVASAFRAGKARAADQERWSFGGGFAIRWGF